MFLVQISKNVKIYITLQHIHLANIILCHLNRNNDHFFIKNKNTKKICGLIWGGNQFITVVYLFCEAVCNQVLTCAREVVYH